MLILPIKKKWFDMIVRQEKLAEYREIKPYYTKRFQTIGLLDKDGKITNKEAWIYLRNGYSSSAPTIKALASIAIDTGIESWGAEPNKLYYILYLSVAQVTENGKIVLNFYMPRSGE